MDYLSKINKNTLANGQACHEQQQVSDFHHELVASLHCLKAQCNGYNVRLELAEHSIFSHNCNCIIGQNNVVCKHVVAVILEFMYHHEILKQDRYGWLDEITNDTQYIELFRVLINQQQWFKVIVDPDQIKIICLLAELVETIKHNRLEIQTILTKALANDQLVNAKVAQLNTQFHTLLELIDTVHIFNTNSQQLTESLQVILSHQTLVSLVFNEHEYQTQFIYDPTKLVNVYATKTSLGYLLYPDFRDAYFSMIKDQVVFFLVFNEYVQWFVSSVDDDDHPNLILKLNLRTSKLISFQERLNVIRRQSLFHVKIHGDESFILQKNSLKLTYDFENQQCVLQIAGNDIDKLVDQYFFKIAHLYDEADQCFRFNDSFHVYMTTRILCRLKKLDVLDITIDEMFNTPAAFDVKYDFEIGKTKLHLQLNVNDLEETQQKQILKAYNKRQKFIGVNNRIYDLETLNFSPLKNPLFNYKKQQFTVNDKYDFNQRNLFFLESKFDSDVLKNFVNQINNEIQTHKYINSDFMPNLKPYQLYGVNWMHKMLELTNGCILADEMGLGKTLQTICLLKYQASLKKHDPTLIIVPLSLISNWISEFKKFWPTQTIIPIVGNAEHRTTIIDNIQVNNIYITTYNLVKNDIDQIKHHDFTNIILDEGQYIKNHKTIWTKLIKSINTTNKIILSGTPIENNLVELWSIFDFIMPNYLPPLSKFKRTYCRTSTTEANLEELALRVNPFILKRKKIDHLNLPTKHIEDIIIQMDKQEQTIYKELFKQLRTKIDVSTDETGNIIKNRIEVLALITRLRQFCCSAELLQIENIANTKVKKLIDIIDHILKNNPQAKIVIFSNFSSMLEILFTALKDQRYQTLIMTGKNSREERCATINNFELPQYSILLLSLKVGGVGLNLTMADHVIHYNPWWNESAELQATDRLHRIGQTKDVHVYRLLYEDSIETDIQKLKQNKTNLIDKMINEISYNDLIKLLKNKD